MLTLNQEEKLIDKIKSLSELEMSSLLSEMNLHLKKSGMSHLSQEVFALVDSDDMEDLQDQISELESKVDKLETDAMAMEGKIEDAIDELEGLDFDGQDSLTDKSKIKNIITTLK